MREPRRPMRAVQHPARYGLELWAYALLTLLVGAGCGGGTDGHVLAPMALVADSTRWVNPDGSVQTYALAWKNGTVNVWSHGVKLYQCSQFDSTHIAVWNAAYRGELVDSTISGVLTAWYSPNGAVVTDGGFNATVGADTVARGWIWTDIAGNPCGARDSIPLLLVPVR